MGLLAANTAGADEGAACAHAAVKAKGAKGAKGATQASATALASEQNLAFIAVSCPGFGLVHVDLKIRLADD
jgi:hypothetical protein